MEDKTLKYGMPTHKDCIKNKNIRTYSAMILQSFYTPSDIVDDRRFIYCKDFKIEKVMEQMNVSKRTIQRNIVALIKSGLIEVVETKDNGCVYKFNYKVDNKYFVEVEHDVLTSLVTSTNSRMISLYLLLKYHLKDGRKQMTQEYIANQIGMSVNSRKEIKQMLNDLAKLGLIAIYEKEGLTTYQTDKGIIKTRPVKELWYELRTHEEWAFLNTHIRQKI